MPDYYYKYTVDENTVEKLSQLNTENWVAEFKNILTNKSSGFNLEFPKLEPVSRIQTLYDVLVTQNIDTNSFQEAVVNLLQENYPVPKFANQSLTLILAIDYIRPSAYASKLIQFVLNPSYSYMLKIRGDDNLSLHLHLINALAPLDTRNSLKDYLKSQVSIRGKKLPEYYQVTLRYLYTYSGEEEFSEFFINIFTDLKEPDIYHLVQFTLLESVIATSSFKYLFALLSGHYLTMEENGEAITANLASFLNDWVEKKKEKVKSYSFYKAFTGLMIIIRVSKEISVPYMAETLTYGGISEHARVIEKSLRRPGVKPRASGLSILHKIASERDVAIRSSVVIRSSEIVFKTSEIIHAKKMNKSEYYINS